MHERFPVIFGKDEMEMGLPRSAALGRLSACSLASSQSWTRPGGYSARGGIWLRCSRNLQPATAWIAGYSA